LRGSYNGVIQYHHLFVFKMESLGFDSVVPASAVRLAFAAFLVSLLFSCTVSAGFTMDLMTSTEPLPDGGGRINFSLSNVGDETALNVMLEPILPEGFKAGPFFVSSLPPNKPVNGSFVVTVGPDVLPGRYPLPLMLHYTDRNDYPFTIVFPESLSHKVPAVSKAFAVIPEVQITGPDAVGFNVRVFNQDSKVHNMTVRLYVPNELSSDVSSTVVELKPQSSSILENKMRSVSALYDSDYLILASVSYVDDGVVYSSIARGRVRLVKPASLQVSENVFQKGWWLVIAVVLVVIVLLAYLTLRERRGVVKNDGKSGAAKAKAGGKVKGR